MGTLIDRSVVTAELVAEDGRLWLDPGELTRLTGWVLKPEGLCRGDVCVPVRDRSNLVDGEGRVDVATFATALHRVAAVDVDHRVAVLSDGGEVVGRTLASPEAPDLVLDDLDGRPHHLSEWCGRKRALVAWASWCGCRHELGSWQRLRDELAPSGFEIVSVALDDHPDAARPWVEAADPGVGHPVLIDPDHRVVEAFGVVNVPSVVWIDEQDRVVRPPVIAPGDDQFRDFTEIDSALHHDQLRAWVHDGTLPPTGDGGQAGPPAPSDELQQARAERRLGAWLHRHGHQEAAEAAFGRAVALAPLDFTVNRGTMGLRGEDPFGTEFFDLWERWVAAGRPGYGSAGDDGPR